MITQIIGSAGSGKSSMLYSLVADSLKKSRTTFLIVPEQSAVNAERRMAQLCEEKNIPSISLEVVSFRRLANRVFRSCGGLSYSYIGQGGKNVVMWRTLCETAPMLHYYSSISLSDISSLYAMTEQIDGLKQHGITASQLLDASELLRAEDNTRLADKISDLSVILAAYNTIMKKDYDDPKEDIIRLADSLESFNFFHGTDVFLDSFYGFSPDEYKVLKYITEQADNFTVTLQDSEDSSLFNESVKNSRMRLLKLYPKGEEIKNIRLSNNLRHKSGALAQLEKTFREGASAQKKSKKIFYKSISHASELYRSSEPQNGILPHTMQEQAENTYIYNNYETEKNSLREDIRIYECQNKYEESEAAALEILKHIRSGGHFRDCFVIVRKMDAWRGITDAVFEKHGIPCFSSARTDILLKPAARLIISALETVGGGWKTNDVITLIKTGMTGLTPEECDVMSGYIASWRIHGKRFYDEYEWNMNPDGYTDKLTEDGARILQISNKARHTVCDPLLMLSLGKATVREYCAAIYQYITQLEIYEKTEKSGDSDAVQIWNSIVDALDCLTAVAGEMKTGADMMSKLFRASLTGVTVGKIPTCTDEVTIGSADLIRPDNCKCAILLGCSEGEFPAAVSESGLFSGSEITELEEIGIELMRGIAEQASDEQLYFYTAACAPSDKLTLTYSDMSDDGRQQKPSIGLKKILAAIPALKTVKFHNMPLEEKLQNRQSAFELAASNPGSGLSQKIFALLSEDGKFKRWISCVGSPLSCETVRIGEYITDALFSDRICLSSTNIEAYAKCAFAYFCKYVLGLREPSTSEFRGADTGNYIHAVIEAFCSAVKNGSFDINSAKESDFDSFTETESIKYTEKIFSGNHIGARQKAFFRRMKNTASLLISDIAEEMKNSKFVPCFFELPVSYSEDAVPPYKIILEDGTSAEIFGRIDRADIMQRGENIFVRITDYKTGRTSDVRDAPHTGIGLQLLLYLRSLCRNDKRILKLISKASGINASDNTSIIPAGVLYMSVKTPELTPDKIPETPEEIYSEAKKSFVRDGILIDDPDVIGAMDESQSGHFIPVKYRRDGSLSAKGVLYSSDELKSLCEAASEKAASVACKIKHGISDAIPTEHTPYTSSVCEYCPIKEVCKKPEFS